ncbi:hypothetical protein [Halocatena marina]|uniref:hypothetical protein n=1 Tax=Halocatena marina TaxID=2934937 RepID=UPI002224D34A|nr:hypothetical protein [Halocatena marina]
MSNTRPCPDCGTELEHDVITETGNENATTHYMGWWCPEHGGHIECDACDQPHHPDYVCASKRSARFAETRGMGVLPNGTSIEIEDCYDVGNGWATYRLEEGCRHCGGDLEVFLEQTQETTPPIGPEWQPSAECCTQYGNGCEHRQLFGNHIELGEEWTITRID